MQVALVVKSEYGNFDLEYDNLIKSKLIKNHLV